jgi:HSP20 family molecular chaperone IbpA
MTTATATLNPTQSAAETKPATVYRPLVDIVNSPQKVLLVVDMPGVDENSVDVTLEKNTLTIRGQVTPPTFEGHKLVHAEYGVGNYERVFIVSEQIERDQIDATVKNGVLRVTLPKSEKAGPQKISVKAV